MSSTTKQIDELLPGEIIKFSDVEDDFTCTIVKVTSEGKRICLSNMKSAGALILDPSDRVVEVIGKRKVTIIMLRIAKAFENSLVS